VVITGRVISTWVVAAMVITWCIVCAMRANYHASWAARVAVCRSRSCCSIVTAAVISWRIVSTWVITAVVITWSIITAWVVTTVVIAWCIICTVRTDYHASWLARLGVWRCCRSCCSIVTAAIISWRIVTAWIITAVVISWSIVTTWIITAMIVAWCIVCTVGPDHHASWLAGLGVWRCRGRGGSIVTATVVTWSIVTAWVITAVVVPRSIVTTWVITPMVVAGSIVCSVAPLVVCGSCIGNSDRGGIDELESEVVVHDGKLLLGVNVRRGGERTSQGLQKQPKDRCCNQDLLHLG
jgi:hypothetical protein